MDAKLSAARGLVAALSKQGTSLHPELRARGVLLLFRLTEAEGMQCWSELSCSTARLEPVDLSVEIGWLRETGCSDWIAAKDCEIGSTVQEGDSCLRNIVSRAAL